MTFWNLPGSLRFPLPANVTVPLPRNPKCPPLPVTIPVPLRVAQGTGTVSDQLPATVTALPFWRNCPVPAMARLPLTVREEPSENVPAPESVRFLKDDIPASHA